MRKRSAAKDSNSMNCYELIMTVHHGVLDLDLLTEYRLVGIPLESGLPKSGTLWKPYTM